MAELHAEGHTTSISPDACAHQSMSAWVHACIGMSVGLHSQATWGEVCVNAGVPMDEIQQTWTLRRGGHFRKLYQPREFLVGDNTWMSKQVLWLVWGPPISSSGIRCSWIERFLVSLLQNWYKKGFTGPQPCRKLLNWQELYVHRPGLKFFLSLSSAVLEDLLLIHVTLSHPVLPNP